MPRPKVTQLYSTAKHDVIHSRNFGSGHEMTRDGGGGGGGGVCM